MCICTYMYVILALLSPLSTGVYVMIYDLLSVVFMMCLNLSSTYRLFVYGNKHKCACACVGAFACACACARACACACARVYVSVYLSVCLPLVHLSSFYLPCPPIVFLSCTATHCNTLQYTATHCNTLQHTATQEAATLLVHLSSVYLP